MGHQFKHQKLRTLLRESMSNYRVKMAMMGFTFTASMVFIIFSFSSLIPIVLSNLTVLFPGRNYMFFISNFLLALIAKKSGLIDSLSPNKNSSDANFGVKPIHKLVKESGGSGSIVLRSDSSVTLEMKKAPSSVGLVEEEEQGTGNGDIQVEVNEGAKAQEQSQEVDEGIQDEEIRLISIDELNKKCDDFIKMMKGGHQFNGIETQKKLILGSC